MLMNLCFILKQKKLIRNKMMKWNKNHRKGTKQCCIFHTESGFWPSGSWLTKHWIPYVEKCKKEGIKPMDCEQYYKSQLK
jgi:hypothetical protein